MTGLPRGSSPSMPEGWAPAGLGGEQCQAGEVWRGQDVLKVAQTDGSDGIGCAAVLDELLGDRLGPAIDVGRVQRGLLGDGDAVGGAGCTIDGGAGRVDEAGALELGHDVEKVDGAGNVDVVVP